MVRLVLASLAVLVIGALVYLLTSADALVARAIEREGTRIAGVPVRVASVDLDLAGGAGRVRGLRVGNPEGFEGEHAFELEEIGLAIDAGSLGTAPLRLHAVEIEHATVYLEVDAGGRSNLDAILGHARERPDADPDAGDGEPTRIAIGKLAFAGGVVALDRPGEDAPDRFELPGFTRRDVGGSRGATGGEIAKLVLGALTRQVAASAAGREVERFVADEIGKSLGEAAGALVRGILGEGSGEGEGD